MEYSAGAKPAMTAETNATPSIRARMPMLSFNARLSDTYDAQEVPATTCIIRQAIANAMSAIRPACSSWRHIKELRPSPSTFRVLIPLMRKGISAKAKLMKLMMAMRISRMAMAPSVTVIALLAAGIFARTSRSKCAS